MKRSVVPDAARSVTPGFGSPRRDTPIETSPIHSSVTKSDLPEVYCERDPDTDAGLCAQDVHGWFQLSYSSYLVVPRVLMQEMSAEWQHAFVNLIDQAHRAFPNSPGEYTVLLRDDAGKFIRDRLRNYRYPDASAIEAAR